jgi:hypothetical protein
LRTAASALENALPATVLGVEPGATPATPATVEPLLIVAGGRLDPSLEEFAKENRVRLIHVSQASLGETANAGPEAIRDRALRLLQIPPGTMPGTPATSSPA